MPGVIAFKRRWGIGSDDFVFPAIGELILRFIWLVILAIVLAAHRQQLEDCKYHGTLLYTYYVGMLILLSFAIILSATIAYVSSRGTVVDGTLRTAIPCLLYTRVALFIPDLAWTAIGTTWAFDSTVVASCNLTVVVVVRCAVAVGWILHLSLIVGIFVVFDPMGHNTLHAESGASPESQRMWKLRCRLLCCCITNNDQTSNAFEEVAQLLADYFHGIDVVPTDIVAGLVLIQHQQHMRATRLDVDAMAVTSHSVSSIPSSETVAQSSDLSPASHLPNWMTLENAAQFMKFAGASYGWPFFVFDNLLCGPCRLWCDCRCCSCIRSADNVFGDNCCSCNMSAILQKTHIRREDVLFASFSNKMYETPFYIAVDHRSHTIVLALRGTLSLEDALTDLMVAADNVSLITEVNDARAHSGILRAANYVADYVTRNHLLEQAFERFPGYRLVVTGHSLGAGSAALVSLLLRRQYSDLMCFAYSPPGWLVSLSLSQYMREFVCSVVVGKDLVPRLGIITMDRLKKNMIHALNNSPHPKYRILVGGVCASCCCPSNIIDETIIETSNEDQQLITPVSRQRRYTDDQLTAAESEGPVTPALIPLYLPGRILYIDEVELPRGYCGVPKYRASWAQPESFDEILVGAKMVTDHMPDVVLRALETLASDVVVEVVTTEHVV